MWDLDPSWFQMSHFYYRDTEITWSCCTPAAFRPTWSSCVSLRYRCYCFLIARWYRLCCIPTVLLLYWVTFVTSRHRTAMSPGESCASCGHCWLVKGETCSNLMRRSVRNSILQPCYSNSCSVAFFRDSRAHSSEVRGGSPPRHAVKNSRGTFSHCNPIFPRKGLFREGSFPQQPHHFAAPLHRKWSSCSPSWTGDPELQRGAPSRTLWSTRWLLKYHLPEISNSTQGAGWLACLT